MCLSEANPEKIMAPRPSKARSSKPIPAHAATTARVTATERVESVTGPAPEHIVIDVPVETTSECTPDTAAAVPANVLKIADLLVVAQRFVETDYKNKGASTKRQCLTTMRFLQSYLAWRGITHSGELTQRHLADWREFAFGLSKDYGRSIKDKDDYPSPELLLAWTERDRRAGKAIGLDVSTIRKHFTYIGKLLKYLRGQGYEKISWDLDDLRPEKKSKSIANRITKKPTPGEVSELLKLAMFTGSQSPDKLMYSGAYIYQCGPYWALCLLITTGTRRNEICDLDVADIIESDDGTLLINIGAGDPNDPNAKTLKNEHSARVIPVPESVRRLGFKQYYKLMKALGYEKLFPDLHSPFYRNDSGDWFYDRIQAQIKAYTDVHGGGEFWDRLIHALRHGFNNELKKRRVDQETREEVLGQTSKSFNTSVYSSPSEVAVMRDAIECYPDIFSGLEVRPIKLLPWVEAGGTNPRGKPPRDWDGKYRDFFIPGHGATDPSGKSVDVELFNRS